MTSEIQADYSVRIVPPLPGGEQSEFSGLSARRAAEIVSLLASHSAVRRNPLNYIIYKQNSGGERKIRPSDIQRR